MLQRVIGEDVEIAVRGGRGLGWVEADFAETEQLVLNLALNARDAMPQGGRLSSRRRGSRSPGGAIRPCHRAAT